MKIKPLNQATVLIIICLSAHLAFTNTWLAADINKWLSAFFINHKLSKIITTVCLFTPTLLLLLCFHYLINISKKNLIKNNF